MINDFIQLTVHRFQAAFTNKLRKNWIIFYPFKCKSGKVVTFAVQVQVFIVLVSSLLYLILPDDLVPDIAFPIGFIDDFIICIFVLVFLSNIYRGLIQRHQPRRVLTRTPQQAPSSHISPVHHRQCRVGNHLLFSKVHNRENEPNTNPVRSMLGSVSNC